MTVKELIENLQSAPMEATVRIGLGRDSAVSIVFTDTNPREVIISHLRPAAGVAVLYDETQT